MVICSFALYLKNITNNGNKKARQNRKNSKKSHRPRLFLPSLSCINIATQRQRNLTPLFRFPQALQEFSMFRLPRLVFLAFSALVSVAPTLMVSSSAFALDVSPTAARTHEQAMKIPAGKFVQSLGDRAIKIIADKQLAADQRSTALSKILSDDFDLKTIGRFVIGRTWNGASPAQQAEYMDLFKALVIRNYGARMTLYTGEGFLVVGTRPESDMDTTVLSQITHPDGSPPTTIDWRVRERDDKMGVIDIVVEGVSLSITQKQEYASVIQNNGGQIDGLLQLMREQLKEHAVTQK
jgi:phospholipid transport system substrate-binding protein